MSGEGTPAEQHEGERYLGLIGLGHFADQVISTSRGDMLARDFLDVCGDHARPALDALAAMGEDDEQRQPVIDALRSAVGGMLGLELEQHD